MFEDLTRRVVGIKPEEFPADSVWLNTVKPLSLGMLKGHVVVLDFWTYCCINCIHMIPELKWIERKYAGKPVVVIGVHSAKFHNENDPANIDEAIQRYGVEHAVVVDRDRRMWEAYGVSGWPTVVMIDPAGDVVYHRSGEGQREAIDAVIGALLERHGKLGGLATPIEIERPEVKTEWMLSYPGKLSFSPDWATFALSDSNHNRVLLIDIDGKIAEEIGGGEEGLRDSGFEDSLFFRPQGVLWVDDRIYVADTENHALREIDLRARRVKTLAGTGRHGHALRSGVRGTEVSLSSPWDLAYSDGTVFMAMAGTHQIWLYDTQSGTVSLLAGTGFEGIVDGDRLTAEFAQPSGLSVDDDRLYVADSEASAVRRIDLRSGMAKTVVGAGLFIFGDEDGPLEQARLQHPLGVFAQGDSVFVADTYNHAIRLIDLSKRQVSTLVGMDKTKALCRIDDPECDTLGLYEPSDVKLHKDGRLFIADTDNHLVRIFDLDRLILQTLSLKA